MIPRRLQIGAEEKQARKFGETGRRRRSMGFNGGFAAERRSRQCRELPLNKLEQYAR
jgi:hypothetical protein